MTTVGLFAVMLMSAVWYLWLRQSFRPTGQHRRQPLAPAGYLAGFEDIIQPLPAPMTGWEYEYANLYGGGITAEEFDRRMVQFDIDMMRIRCSLWELV